MHPLDAATTLTPCADDRLRAELDPRFWGHVAAHGGYLAALLLRAMIEKVNDASRAPRSLTVHFLRGPEPGAAEVWLEPLRTGGKISALTARIVQGGTPTTFAVGAFGSAFDASPFQRLAMPELAPPEQCPPFARSRVAIDQRFEHRVGLGAPPFSGAQEARVGGWSRLEPARAHDALSMAILCDAWWPALFSRFSHRSEANACPTVDLTIHFRTSFPLASLADDAFVAVELRSEALSEGFFDESCRIWAPDGQLLATSVQHAVSLRR